MDCCGTGTHSSSPSCSSRPRCRAPRQHFAPITDQPCCTSLPAPAGRRRAGAAAGRQAARRRREGRRPPQAGQALEADRAAPEEGRQRRVRRAHPQEHGRPARAAGARQTRLRTRAGAAPRRAARAGRDEGPPRTRPRPRPTRASTASTSPTGAPGHPPDTNGDVGPNYYIQTVNTSIGIYDKSTGNRVAAFTFNTFMSQGHFGNLCDTDNFGDPVVLYDSFEDRWFITDFAFKLDGSRERQPAARVPVLRRLEDRRSGQRRLELLLDRDARRPRRLSEVRRLAGRHLHVGEHVRLRGRRVVHRLHVWALNKQQMYAGAPTRAGRRLRRRTPTSRSSRRTRGSRPARRRPARPSTSSRPSSS